MRKLSHREIKYIAQDRNTFKLTKIIHLEAATQTGNFHNVFW